MYQGSLTDALRVVIVDEAHRMKKANGRLAFAVKKLKARACFALTGTLIQNRMEEMWSILDFVSRCYVYSADVQVHRGWAGTIKEWREYAAKPVSRGHRSDGTILEVCRAIVRFYRRMFLTPETRWRAQEQDPPSFLCSTR